MNQEDKKIANRKYYEENKERMKSQISDSRRKRRSDKKIQRSKLLHKLNTDTYKRIPWAKLQEYDIQFDGEKYI